MFGDLSLIEKKLFISIAVADRKPASPWQPVANRLFYAHVLYGLGDKDVADAIAKCCMSQDRQPMAVHCPGDTRFVTKDAAEAFLRKKYREWLGVQDVSLRRGFPIAVLDRDGLVVDVLEYVTSEVSSEEPAPLALVRAG